MKNLFITLMVCVGIVSCSKSDVIYNNEQSEIGLVPYSLRSTKAAVNSTDYPDALNMYVFAKAGEADATVPTGFTEDYLKNAEFGHRTDLSTKIFGGTPNAYYWPNIKHLIFAGYSKSGNVSTLVNNANTAPTHTLENNVYKISINGYEPGNGTATLGDNDLMWFPTTTTSYGKQNNAIDVTMQHACSWITIKIKGDITTGATNTSWKIKSLTLDKLITKGNVNLTTEAVWTTDETNANNNVSLFSSTDGKALTQGFVDYTGVENNAKVGEYYDFVVVPQDVRNLTIQYQYEPQAGITAQEPIVISLAYDNETAWQPGYHYTYEITIGTTEILLNPTAKKWEIKEITL